VGVPIATGERLLTPFDYREFLAHPTAADVVQPDVNNCGGIAQLKEIAGMAAADYLPVVPHNSRGPVATAAAARALATVLNALALEYFPGLPPWRGELTVGDERVVDGEYVVPDGPGLGVELDREALDRHPYEKADTAEYRYSKGFDRFW
jgi:galactonate dehydratase